MLPNVRRQTATPQQAITNSNGKGEGGISPPQPCLICRLLGNWNVPLLCCCLKVCETLRGCRTCIRHRRRRMPAEREEKREAEPNKKTNCINLILRSYLQQHTGVETSPRGCRPTNPEMEQRVLMPGALHPCSRLGGNILITQTNS